MFFISSFASVRFSIEFYRFFRLQLRVFTVWRRSADWYEMKTKMEKMPNQRTWTCSFQLIRSRFNGTRSILFCFFFFQFVPFCFFHLLLYRQTLNGVSRNGLFKFGVPGAGGHMAFAVWVAFQQLIVLIGFGFGHTHTRSYAYMYSHTHARALLSACGCALPLAGFWFAPHLPLH